MNRKEMYQHIKGLGLEDEIKAVYGKNYTQCSNVELESVVSNVISSLKQVTEKDINVVKLAEVVSRLINTLEKKRILLPSEINAIFS